MSRRSVSMIGAAIEGARLVAGSFKRYRPSAAAVIYDPETAEKWRRMVDAADRFDVFPDDEAPISYTLTDKASA